MVTSQVYSGLRHQGGQPGNEIQRLEDDVRSAIAIQCRELVTDIAIRRERQALFRDRRAADVAVQSFEQRQVAERTRHHAGIP